MLIIRRISRGSRPAASAASSIAALLGPMFSRYCIDGSQPSALAPVSFSMRGL